MRFQLFAPTVEAVSLVASWLRRPSKMTRDAAGTWSVESRPPDGRHTYQFRVKSRSFFMEGKRVDVTDPFARLIDESDGDKGVLVIEGGQDVTTAYEWCHDDVPLPPDHQLAMYELHIGEFGWTDAGQGTFATVLDHLDYLAELGVNAVELMPVMAFPTDSSWGYNVRHACAVENAYGTPQDLKRLIDECHARGLRVVLDVVFNHTESESPLTKIDWGYWFRDPRDGELSFGPKLDYERVDDTVEIDGEPVWPARRFALAVAAHWQREYHIDGYRLDATAILDNFDVVRMLRAQGKALSGGKPFYVVAEQLPEDPSIAGPDGPADGAWHQRFMHQILGNLRGHGADAEGLADALQPATAGYVVPELAVNFMVSHDERTLMEILSEAGISGEAAFRKAKLGASLLLTAVGIPLIYQGEEFAGYRPRSMEIRPLQWELLDADFGLHLKEHYEFFLALRRDHPALTGAGLTVLQASDQLVAFCREAGDDVVLVVANLRDEDREFDIPAADGPWRELTFAYDVQVTGGRLRNSIPPSAAKVYVRR